MSRHELEVLSFFLLLPVYLKRGSECFSFFRRVNRIKHEARLWNKQLKVSRHQIYLMKVLYALLTIEWKLKSVHAISHGVFTHLLYTVSFYLSMYKVKSFTASLFTWISALHNKALSCSAKSKNFSNTSNCYNLTAPARWRFNSSKQHFIANKQRNADCTICDLLYLEKFKSDHIPFTPLQENKKLV